MGISYIPGPEAVLGPAAAQIGAALVQFLDPNKQFREGMRSAIATNPQLLQQLADVEAIAPGTLGNLGFGNLTNTITRTPQSAESQFAQENKGEIKKNAQVKLKADTKRAELSVEQGAAVLDLMKKNPKMTYEMAAKELTGETESQRLQRPAAELEGKRATATMEAMRNLDVANIGTVDMLAEARKFLKGQLPTSRLRDYMVVPETRAIWQDAIEAVMMQKRMDHDTLLQKQRDDPMNGSTFFFQKAFQMFDQSNAGTTATWLDYMYGNNGKGRKSEAEALSKKPSSELSPEERDLVEVYQADKQMKWAATNRQAKEYNLGLQRAVEDFRKGYGEGIPRSELDIKLGGVQMILDAKNSLTGRGITAKYGDVPGTGRFFPDEGIYFVDEQGKVLDNAAVFSDIVPTGSAAEKTQNAIKEQTFISARVAQYFEAPVNKRAELLTKWQLEDQSEGKRLSKAVLQAIKDK